MKWGQLSARLIRRSQAGDRRRTASPSGRRPTSPSVPQPTARETPDDIRAALVAKTGSQRGLVSYDEAVANYVHALNKPSFAGPIALSTFA